MYQKTTLAGNLGQDPKSAVIPGENPVSVAHFSVATNEFSKGQQYTEWHDVEVFGQSADYARDHLKKGDLVLVEGTLRTKQWKDRSGVEQKRKIIHATQLKGLSRSDAEKLSQPTQPNIQGTSSVANNSAAAPIAEEVMF